MAVSASPAARAVRTACFAEQMEQKKQLLITSSQKSYPPAFHSLRCKPASGGPAVLASGGLAGRVYGPSNTLVLRTTKAGLVVKFVKAEVRVVGVVAVRWGVHKRPCRVLLPRELEGALCGSGDC
jgi:hypothetical protein